MGEDVGEMEAGGFQVIRRSFVAVLEGEMVGIEFLGRELAERFGPAAQVCDDVG